MRYNRSIILSALGIIGGLSSFVIIIVLRLGEKFNWIAYLLMGITIVSIVASFLLNDRNDNTDQSSTAKKDLSDFEKRIEALIKTSNLNSNNIENIEETVYRRLKDNFTNNLLNVVENKFKVEFSTESLTHAIASETNEIKASLNLYIGKLQRNSIVNLIIGICATFWAIYILSETVYNPIQTKEINIFLLNFLPRVSFVIFVQIFAFFFLKLYKNNLDDARYFQNEMTNIFSKSAALKLTQQKGSDELMEKILLLMASTERNFKISKEETMLELEKAKLEKAENYDLISSLKDFMKSIKE